MQYWEIIFTNFTLIINELFHNASIQVLFDALGCLRKYESPLDILKEFFELRLERYAIRKAWLEGMLTAESSKLNSQARFILEKIEGQIVIGKSSAWNTQQIDVMKVILSKSLSS